MRLHKTWYPDQKDEIHNFFQTWAGNYSIKAAASACIVPHAGWFYSGKLAFNTISALKRDTDNVIICGGHLQSGSRIAVCESDYWETPLGNLSIDTKTINDLKLNFSCTADIIDDNTIEIQTAIIKHFFPEAQIIPLRIPADETAVKLAAYFNENFKDTVLIASTDLSHYGPGYSYTPFGTGKKAFETVTKEIDPKIIESLRTMDSKKALHLSVKDKSACSIGAAVTAAEFSLLKGLTGVVLDYYTSAHIQKSNNFVGYAGIYYK